MEEKRRWKKGKIVKEEEGKKGVKGQRNRRDDGRSIFVVEKRVSERYRFFQVRR